MALGFAWNIEGDDNRNARVAVAYRKKGDRKWSRGARSHAHAERADLDARRHRLTAPNMFAGSIFDLDEATEYEVRLSHRRSGRRRPAKRKRRSPCERAPSRSPPPTAASSTFIRQASRARSEQPAFSGLLEAYYMASLGGDWSRASPPRVRAGDVIKVHAGLYLSKHDHYSHEINSRFTTCCGTPWDGTYYLTQDGTPEKPIAIVGAGDGEAIFDGDGNTVLFNLMGGDYHYFEGITFRNTGTAIEAGMKDIAGAKGLTVKRMKFENIGTAVHSDWSGSQRLLHRGQRHARPRDPRLRLHVVRRQAVGGSAGLRRDAAR